MTEDDVRRAIAERDRYREALREIRDRENELDPRWAREVARFALGTRDLTSNGYL